MADDIATARFSCQVSLCKGACCVVGDAGAPVSRQEIPVLRKAWDKLKGELRSRAREVVEQEGLVKGNNRDGYELACTDSRECVFVTYDGDGAARCAIQQAYYEGRLNWEKPISCHLFPVRLKRVAGFDYASFEYIPSLCASACEHGSREGIWLSDFLEEPLSRRYGAEWYETFSDACREKRASAEEEGVPL